MARAIFGHERDNVVTCCTALDPGDTVELPGGAVSAAERVPIYHKMAIRRIAAGERVYKYGQPIGLASRDIEPGCHVHVQNLESDRGRGDRK